MNKINSESFGDPKKFPVIDSIVGIFNTRIESNHYNKNEFQYCTKLINEYNVLINSLNVLEKDNRKYFMELLRNDFLKRLSKAKLTEIIFTHMCNLIVAIYRNKVEIFIDRENV